MNKTQIFSGLLAASLTSAVLYAAPAITADGTTKTEAMAKADAMFAKMDANSDGTLNQSDRAEKVKEHFAEMDADKNGAINEAEFVAAHEARMGKREGRSEMRGKGKGKGSHDGHRMSGRGPDGNRGGGMKMLAMADTNGDKAVTKDEFRTAAEARFAKADTNNDGSISAEERKAQRADKRGGNRGGRPAAAADAG